MLKYKGKFSNLTEDDFASLTRHKYIEIVPFGKENFDINSLIDFMDAITQSYICIKLKQSQGKISITAKHSLLEAGVSIKITIINFTEFHVFIRDGIHYMDRDDINEIRYVCFQPFSLKNSQFDYFSQNVKWNSDFPFKNSVLFTFGKFSAKDTSNAPLFLKYAFNGFLHSRTLLRKKSILSSNNSFLQMCNHLPGFVYILYQKVTENSSFLTKKNKKRGFLFQIEDSQTILKSLIWIMPWAVRIIDKIHYIELDASYKAVRPYYYCVYHGVYFNSSIPFALSIYPSESEELFELLFIGLDKFKLNSKPFESKQVLSDMGPAIISFSKNHFYSNNFCHRHIIERFGANCGMGFWVAKILQSKTYYEYLMIREEILAELYEYETIIDNSPLIDQNRFDKILDLKIMLALPEDIEEGRFGADIIESNYYFTKWANWERRKHHMPRCSNHCEGLHGNVNNLLPKTGIFSMKTGFSKIADYILNYLNRRKDIYGDSFKKKHIKIIEKVRTILKNGPNSYLKCGQQKCDCEDDLYNSSIYGVNFPCVHTILYNLVSNELFQNFIKTNSVDVDELFIICFKFCPYSTYEKSIFDVKIQDISQKITNYFIDKYPHLTESQSDITEIVKQFIQCFTYILPDFLDVGLYQNYHNICLKDEDKREFSFNKKFNNKDKFVIKYEDIKVSTEIGDDVKNLIKKKYNETQHEVYTLYPKLNTKEEESICFNIFMDYVFEHPDLNKLNELPRILAKFKIKCWLEADKLMKSNKFFE